ncbi:MAG: tRNA uridine-5-carboxymethylaminomethyl(34) synthesis GTPase MnmE [Clostridia bacterium]|nr:tRNA uridine-5-carboxymethylaminomethyl(34) synthesis GTPase MnmE [Clostridia bacterium]
MSDTIAAISTAYGEGGVSIIRISGDDALAVLKRVFKGSREFKDRFMNYGHVIDPKDGSVIDEVLACYMKAPKTYTREDVVEINCHGSLVSQRKALEVVLENGARLAEPGEFTKRAFLNGRLDLSQAEAVIDLIHAKGDASFNLAMAQLEGNFSKNISNLRKKLMDSLVDITVNIDYPDEDIEELTYSKLISALEEVKEDIDKLIKSSQTGKMLKDGLKLAIVGKPNVGKSTLMNALLNEARAIVTNIPGTTRDTISEDLSLEGIPIRLTDTAGIRDTEDIIEKIGIDKSREAIKEADLVVFMLDGSRPLDQEDEKLLELVKGKKLIVLLNKSDQGVAVSHVDCDAMSIIKTSLVDGQNLIGLEELKEKLKDLVYDGKVNINQSEIITNLRHKELLEAANKAIGDSLVAAQMGEALEIIEIDVNEAYVDLGKILGETVEEDIINEVFSRFCLGK